MQYFFMLRSDNTCNTGRTIYDPIDPFGVAEVKSQLRDIDKWIRRKLRCYLYKQWGRSGYRKLKQLGVKRQLAWNTAKSAHGPWRLSSSPALTQALPDKYFSNLGLPSLVA